MRRVPCHPRRRFRTRPGRPAAQSLEPAQLHRRAPAQPAGRAGAMDRRAAGPGARHGHAQHGRSPGRCAGHGGLSLLPAMTAGGALQAAGEAARAIETVSWVLFAGGLAIFAAVMLLLAWAVRRRGAPVRPALWILGGGVLFPGVVLAALFAWTLPLSPL